MRALCPLLLALVTTVSLSVPALSRAESGGDSRDDQARELFEEGVEALGEEDYATALVAFERAYELSERPILLYNIGMCHRALLRFPEAIEAFRRYQRETGDEAPSERLRRVEDLIIEMERSLALLRVEVERDGATLLVDGREVGSTPLSEPLSLSAGSHVVEARLEGFQDARVAVNLMARETRRVMLTLEPVPGDTAELGDGPRPRRQSLARRWWFWTIVGAVVVGGAVTAGVLARPDEEEVTWTIQPP